MKLIIVAISEGWGWIYVVVLFLVPLPPVLLMHRVQAVAGEGQEGAGIHGHHVRGLTVPDRVLSHGHHADLVQAVVGAQLHRGEGARRKAADK